MIHALLLAIVIGAVIAAVVRSSRRPGYHPPPGWYLDPWQQATWRWWNGQWTGFTHD